MSPTAPLLTTPEKNGIIVDTESCYAPARLRKLMLRLAQACQPGMAYTITLIMPTGEGEPTHIITPLGRVENQRV